jgi:hypothetical protein
LNTLIWHLVLMIYGFHLETDFMLWMPIEKINIPFRLMISGEFVLGLSMAMLMRWNLLIIIRRALI